MGMYEFDENIDRRNTNSLKYDGAAVYYPDSPETCLPMWVADMDFACPRPILDAMKARIDRRILGYSGFNDADYFRAVTGWMKRRHGWDVSPDSIVFASGIVPALNALVRELTEPGDRVIVNTPAYAPFYRAIVKQDRLAECSPLINTGDSFAFDYDDLERKAKDPRTRLFFLCNPHNPAGRVWSEEELRRVAEICFANDVFIVSDEIHSDFIRKGQKHIPLAKLFENDKRIITCTSPSKTFNLAGNQLSNIIIPDEKIARAWRNRWDRESPNPVSIEACKAAYDQCEGWVDALNAYLDGNFALLKTRLDTELPRAKFTIPQGTYLAWVDLGCFGFDCDELKKRITAKGLLIEYETDFVKDGTGFVRINLACPRATVDKAVDLLVSALARGH